MAVLRIINESGHKKCLLVHNRGQYLAERGSEEQKARFKAAREGDENAKAQLLQYNYTLFPPKEVCSLRGYKKMGDTFCHDIDCYDKAEADKIVEKMLGMKEELGLLMLERTAHYGLHSVHRRERGKTILECQVRVATMIDAEMDTNTKDAQRIWYASTDDPDELLYLDDALFECNMTEEEAEAEYNLLRERSAKHLDNVPESARKSDKHWRATKSLSSPISQPSSINDNPSSLNSHPSTLNSQPSSLNYMGVPYCAIIKKWWEMYNDGQEPVKSNRNVLTFELAVNLRHICGYDRETLSQVIPCYDGFSETEKMSCIDSALSSRMTQMPKRLKDVLTELKREILNGNLSDNADIVAALDQANAMDKLYHYNRLPGMPRGVRDSIEAAGHTLAMPTLIAIAPAIGALATGIKLDVHGKARGLNLCSFIVGEFASGKGQMDDIIAAWMNELQTETDIYTQEEEEWATKTSRMKSGKAPEQPKLPVRMLTLNNTVANIASRLANTEGKHSFSFTPEADNVALKWKQSVSDFSVMLRQAYDEARYDREAKSADAVRVHIQKLLWNVTLCGTQDALYRVITNYTDGLLSRIAIARTPDNTFAPLEEDTAKMTELQAQHIKQIAHLLPLLQGNVTLPKLEERGREWLEMIRLESIKNDDRVLARQRFRGCVNAQRITTALWLPRVLESLIRKHGYSGAEKRLRQNPELWVEMLKRQQSEDMMQLFDIIADYLLDNDLYFFRERIEKAYEGRNYHGNANAVRSHRGKNDSIFSRLADIFSFEQAFQHSIAVKGMQVSKNSVQQMLKNWRNQGLVNNTDDGKYRKL